MIVCPNEKITYMNIPKTGTRSVLHYFQDNMEAVSQHGHRVNPPRQFLTDEYFIFASIRNPYDRACSYYWSMCQRGGDRYRYLRIMRNKKLDNSLKSWLIVVQCDIAERKRGRRGQTGHPFNPQMTYIEGNNVEKLIHLENIDEEFSALPFIIEPVKLIHMNHTTKPRGEKYIPRPPWQDLVGKEEAEMINEMCKVDFDAFPEYEKI